MSLLLLLHPKPVVGAVTVVTGMFDDPTPSQDSTDSGTPNYDEPTPSASTFDEPTPS